ncbi:hypothetical protein ANN_24281 [Periplaneta americana]|uniref:Uncharacterized protein n=1 Tax=Periplaneta americana TaxID=6978 RepID=A0ABQ8S2M3_PERAM|nr:hypothetical protein ANN_24281 [Periplaneta americana]
MAGLCEGGNEPPGSLKASKGTWFRERHYDDTPLGGQRQIQMERSLTPRVLTTTGLNCQEEEKEDGNGGGGGGGDNGELMKVRHVKQEYQEKIYFFSR